MLRKSKKKLEYIGRYFDVGKIKGLHFPIYLDLKKHEEEIDD